MYECIICKAKSLEREANLVNCRLSKVSAKAIVGEVTQYEPHGNTAVLEFKLRMSGAYESLVELPPLHA